MEFSSTPHPSQLLLLKIAVRVSGRPIIVRDTDKADPDPEPLEGTSLVTYAVSEGGDAIRVFLIQMLQNGNVLLEQILSNPV